MAFLSRILVASWVALFLTGCSSSAGTTDAGSDAGGGGTILVTGTVLNNVGQPYAGRTVVVSSGSFTKTQLTDTNGAFSVQDVPTPYTATVVDTGAELAISYVGLTRVDPTLTDILTPTFNRSATLTGALTGGSYPETGLDSTSFVFASPDIVRELNSPTSANYQAQVTWAGPATTTGTLYAIQTHNSSGGPTGYSGYGTRPNVTLDDMGTLSGQDIALSPVDSGTVSGTATAATGYSLAQSALQLLVAPGVALNLFTGSLASVPTFSYAAPSVAGSSLLVAAAANGPSGEYVATQLLVPANAAGVALNLPEAPALGLPSDGATGVTPGTAFSWTAPSGVYLFQAYRLGGATFLVVTADMAATLPDLTDAGLPLVARATYTWDVIGFAPVASVDAAAGAGGLNRLLYGTLTEGQSVTRTFTVAAP